MTPSSARLKPIIRQRFEQGSSAPKLGQEFGVSPSTIYWWSSREKWGKNRADPNAAPIRQPLPQQQQVARATAHPPHDDLWLTRSWMT